MTRRHAKRSGIRVMDWSIRDENGVVWDRIPGWIAHARVASAIARADRTVIHLEAERKARDPLPGEQAKLAALVSQDGDSGAVCASEYRHNDRYLLVLSVVDR